MVKKPKDGKLFFIFSILCGIYFFTYLLVNSFAQTNGLNKKSFVNPVGWFQPDPTPTPTNTPTPTPTNIPTTKPTTKPVVRKVVNPTVATNNSATMVNCQIADKCGGGSKVMEKSECESMTCCGVGDKFYFTKKDQCNQDQSNSNPDNWPEVRTNGGNLVLRCKGDIEAVKRADEAMATAYNLYSSPELKCQFENHGTEQCQQLDNDWNKKWDILKETIKVEGCLTAT